MNQILIAVVPAFLTGVFAWVTAKSNNSTQKEGIYADHQQNLFDRVDRLTNERDDLKQQVINLTSQVNELNKSIEEQNKLIRELQNRLGVKNEQLN